MLNQLIVWRDGGPADEKRSFDAEAHSISGTSRIQLFVRLVWMSKGQRDVLDKSLETTSADDVASVFASLVAQVVAAFDAARQAAPPGAGS